MSEPVTRWVVRSKDTGLYWLGYLKPSRWVRDVARARLYEVAPGNRWDVSQVEILSVRVTIEVLG